MAPIPQIDPPAPPPPRSLSSFLSASYSHANVYTYSGYMTDIKCPMKSFRIPMTRMQLSEDAYKSALHVNTIRDAEEFIDAYGSHVSNGRQEVMVQLQYKCS